MSEIEIRLQETHHALNNLLALWISEHGEDYNVVDHAKQALERNQMLMPTLPVTLTKQEPLSLADLKGFLKRR